MPASFSFSVVAGSVATSEASVPAGAEAGASAFRDFGLDPDGDLSLIEGDFPAIVGVEGVASDLGSRLQTFLGEYFLDLSIGLPYFTEIFGKPTNARLEAIFREEILKTPGVGSIQQLRVSKTDRELTVTMRVVTDFGALIEAVLEA